VNRSVTNPVLIRFTTPSPAADGKAKRDPHRFEKRLQNGTNANGYASGT
jgi:hypothetical protein